MGKDDFSKKLLIDLQQYIPKNIGFFPTQFNLLNASLQSGTVNPGIVLIYGCEGTGKSTLSLQIAKKFLDKGDYAIYIDTEHALSYNRVHQVGLRLAQEDTTGGEKKILLVCPDTLEDTEMVLLKILDNSIKEKKIGLIIWDSLKQTPSKVSFQSSISDVNVAVEARMLSKLFEKLPDILSKSRVTLIILNQLTTDIQVDRFSHSTKGMISASGYTLPRGLAQKFAAAQALFLSRGRKWERGDRYGTFIRILPEKNKCGSPLQLCELVLDFESGLFSDLYSCVEFLNQRKLLSTSGGVWKIQGEKSGHRFVDFIKNVKKNPKPIEDLLRKALEEEYGYTTSEVKLGD